MNRSSDGTEAIGAFGLFRGEEAASAFSLSAQLRSMGAVVPLLSPAEGSGRGVWAVTRMEEAVQVLKDHAHFTVDPRSIGVDALLGPGRAESAGATGFFTHGGSMLTVDEPDHRRLRDGEGIGIVLDDVHPALTLHSVEQLVGDLLDTRAKALHVAGRERPGDETGRATARRAGRRGLSRSPPHTLRRAARRAASVHSG